MVRYDSSRLVIVLVVISVVLIAAQREGAAEPSAPSNAEHSGAVAVQRYGHWAGYVAHGKRTALTKCWGQKDSPLDPGRCALLVVHMEKETMERNTMMDAVGTYNPGLRDQYYERVENVVVPNLDKLIAFFKRRKIPVFFTSLASEGPHPRFAKNIDENDVVIAGTTADVFFDTELDHLFKQKHIDTIFITGLGTSHCVTFSAYGAMSRGYQLIVVPDATADPRPDHYEAILKVLGLHAFLKSTEDVIAEYPWQSWIESSPLPIHATN